MANFLFFESHVKYKNFKVNYRYQSLIVIILEILNFLHIWEQLSSQRYCLLVRTRIHSSVATKRYRLIWCMLQSLQPLVLVTGKETCSGKENIEFWLPDLMHFLPVEVLLLQVKELVARKGYISKLAPFIIQYIHALSK